MRSFLKNEKRRNAPLEKELPAPRNLLSEPVLLFVPLLIKAKNREETDTGIFHNSAKFCYLFIIIEEHGRKQLYGILVIRTKPFTQELDPSVDNSPFWPVVAKVLLRGRNIIFQVDGAVKTCP